MLRSASKFIVSARAVIQRPSTSLRFASSASSQSDSYERDVTVSRSDKQAIALLRRVADAIESGKSWRVTVDKKVVVVPTAAKFSLEHEVEEGNEQCLELQFKWVKA
jgi:amphi-Trp domain-containing protein